MAQMGSCVQLLGISSDYIYIWCFFTLESYTHGSLHMKLIVMVVAILPPNGMLHR